MSNFSEWLRNEIDKRKISQSDLARMLQVTPAQVSRILSGERSTTAETLTEIAHILKISPITIFRRAGLLPTIANGDEALNFSDWEYLLSQLPSEDQEELRQIAELKIERRQKQNSLKSLKHRKAG